MTNVIFEVAGRSVDWRDMSTGPDAASELAHLLEEKLGDDET